MAHDDDNLIDLTPSPEFLAACRKVLGDDSPSTVLGAIRERDPRMNEVRALVVRDPALWLCSAVDPDGIPRVWAKGDSEQEAREMAEREAGQYRESKPLSAWSFSTYPPGEI